MNDAGDGEAFGVLRPGVAFRSSPETSVFGNGLRRTQSGVEPPHSKALALHFVILSGLRYTQHEFLEFLGSANMIPITYELAKQSSTFRAMVKDVKQEARGQGRSEGLAEGTPGCPRALAPGPESRSSKRLCRALSGGERPKKSTTRSSCQCWRPQYRR